MEEVLLMGTMVEIHAYGPGNSSLKKCRKKRQLYQVGMGWRIPNIEVWIKNLEAGTHINQHFSQPLHCRNPNGYVE